jgi:hypothetical protein
MVDDDECGAVGGMRIGRGKPKYSEKTCSSATLFITNPTWPYLASNPGRRDGKLATNRLSYVNTGVNPKPETLCTSNTTPTTVNVQHDINISKQHILWRFARKAGV